MDSCVERPMLRGSQDKTHAMLGSFVCVCLGRKLFSIQRKRVLDIQRIH